MTTPDAKPAAPQGGDVEALAYDALYVALRNRLCDMYPNRGWSVNDSEARRLASYAAPAMVEVVVERDVTRDAEVERAVAERIAAAIETAEMPDGTPLWRAGYSAALDEAATIARAEGA